MKYPDHSHIFRVQQFGICLLLSTATLALSAQSVGINETGQPPNAGAILDVQSTDKGVLLPRTTASSITAPVEGMVIYDTEAESFRYFKQGAWTSLVEHGDYGFWWADKDGDGFGDPFNVIYAPEPPPFYIDNSGDCDDDNPDVHPNASEICDGIDNNCNGLIDEDNPGGGAVCGSSIGVCQQGVRTCVNGELVCLGEVGPQPEVCDGLDNDCDGMTDEEPIDGTAFYPDADSDSYGDANAEPIYACEPPTGYVDNNLDCNDSDPDTYPGAPELCDGSDNNCNGEIDEGGVCCEDGVQNGLETDVDCGGGECPPCMLGQNCLNISDCGPGLVCEGGVCVPECPGSSCLIDGQCYADGDFNPSNPCLVCDSELNPHDWTPVAAATVCGTSHCDGFTYTGASLCDGAGVCIEGPTYSCAPYMCNSSGTACRTSCDSDTHCVSTHYCNNGVCVPKLGSGEPCDGDNQCQSGVCVNGFCE